MAAADQGREGVGLATPPCRRSDRHTPRSCYAPHFLRHKLRFDPSGLLAHLASLNLVDPSSRPPPRCIPLPPSTIIGTIPADAIAPKEAQALASILRGAATAGGSSSAVKLATVSSAAATLGACINSGMANDLPDVDAELGFLQQPSGTMPSTLAAIVAGLLHHDRSLRMTASGCRQLLLSTISFSTGGV